MIVNYVIGIHNPTLKLIRLNGIGIQKSLENWSDNTIIGGKRLKKNKRKHFIILLITTMMFSFAYSECDELIYTRCDVNDDGYLIF